MKKKVLIIIPTMSIGGAERSLLGLLDSFDYDIVDVSLFLYRHNGEFLKYVNSNVKVLDEIPEYTSFDVSIRSLLFSSKWKLGLLRLKAKAEMQIHAKRYPDENGLWMKLQMISRNLQEELPDIPGEYDLGIQFLSVPDVLVNKVNAEKKIAWNHTDYTTQRPDKVYDRKIYGAIDYIVSVSDQCRYQFLKVYPDMEHKAIVMENILSESLIKTQSNEKVYDFSKPEYGVTALSIGRYDYAKNFENVPEICHLIREKGIDLKWYIIGYGNYEEKIKTAIENNHMENNVILLGKKENPYPYIERCDVYIQPSRFEGKSVTVREAQMLGKPVIIANYATAKDQVTDGIDGVIVPQPNNECADALYEVLTDQKFLSQIAVNCQQRDYTNKNEIQMIYQILGI